MYSIEGAHTTTRQCQWGRIQATRAYNVHTLTPYARTAYQTNSSQTQPKETEEFTRRRERASEWVRERGRETQRIECYTLISKCTRRVAHEFIQISLRSCIKYSPKAVRRCVVFSIVIASLRLWCMLYIGARYSRFRALATVRPATNKFNFLLIVFCFVEHLETNNNY